jgi:hypothetical protein
VPARREPQAAPSPRGRQRTGGTRPPAPALPSTIGNRAFAGLVAGRALARFQDAEHTVVDPRPAPAPAPGSLPLQGSVGRGGANDPADCDVVRGRLHELGYAPGTSLDELGAAIEDYQRSALHWTRTDGRVDAGGRTQAALAAGVGARSGPAPPGPGPGPGPGPQPDPTPPPDPGPDTDPDQRPTPVAQGRGTPGSIAWYWKNRVTGEEQVSWTVNLPQAEWFHTTAKNEYFGNGKDIYQFVFHANGRILRGQPHMLGYPGSYAWLDNNPGNLTGPPYWGAYEGKFNWTPTSFLIFPTYEAGMRAIPPFLKNPHGRYLNKTIRDAFRTYAPKGHGGNQPDKYAEEVARKIGKDPDGTFIRDLGREEMKAMAQGIKDVEGTIPGKEFTLATLPPALRATLP